MSQDQARPPHASRRDLLQGAAALSAAGIGFSLRPGPALAQDAARTLVIASPATSQGLDIGFAVSLGSISTLACKAKLSGFTYYTSDSLRFQDFGRS